MSRPLVLIQARTASTRLPNKINLRIGPRRMLDHVIDRVRATGLAYGVCRPEDWWPVREEDVLGRFHAMLTTLDGMVEHYDPILRVTADCPLWEGWVAEMALHLYQQGEWDLVHTSPAWDGLDVEVMSRASLARAHYAAGEAHDREHVTRWLRENAHSYGIPLDGPVLRWSVDDEDGLAFVRGVIARCEYCRDGVPHHTNAGSSIGGADRSPRWDLHHLDRGDLVECLAGDLRMTRTGGMPYVSR